MTHYDVLEVRTDASPEDIKAAYRQLAKERHPDKGGTAEAMAELTEAYAVLRDPDTRRDYDRHLARGRRRTSPRPAAPPPDVLARGRRVNAFDEFVGRVAAVAVAAAFGEVEATLTQRFRHLPPGQRPPTLREILEATADPVPSTTPPRGPGTRTPR